jgi:hypothetical protein
LGGKSKISRTGDGDTIHFRMKAKFVGSILCDDVISIKKEPTGNDDTIFTIDKKFWSKQKIINIQNRTVGKVTIKCKKIYAEKLDCYFDYKDGWRKEEL